MKKLIIAAAIVCAAAMSQAAVADWKFSVSGAAATDTYNTEYNVYLVDAVAWDALSSDAKTYDAMKANLISTANNVGQMTSVTGKGTKTFGMPDALTVSNGSWTKGDTIDVYYMLVKDINGTPADYIAVADTLTARDGTDQTQIGPKSLVAQADLPAAQSFGGAAPEPTSGLLLLLGVAGLALRRKRA